MVRFKGVGPGVKAPKGGKKKFSKKDREAFNALFKGLKAEPSKTPSRRVTKSATPKKKQGPRKRLISALRGK